MGKSRKCLTAVGLLVSTVAVEQNLFSAGGKIKGYTLGDIQTVLLLLSPPSVYNANNAYVIEVYVYSKPKYFTQSVEYCPHTTVYVYANDCFN